MEWGGGDKVAPALPTTLSSLHYCLVVASLFNIVFHIWTIIVILPNKHRLHKQRYTNLQPPSLPPYASPFHILVVHLIQLCILHVGFKLVLTSVTERCHQVFESPYTCHAPSLRLIYGWRLSFITSTTSNYWDIIKELRLISERLRVDNLPTRCSLSCDFIKHLSKSCQCYNKHFNPMLTG